MRLEVLITKYLDGELTVAEDKELRQLIAENPDAKSAFDQSVAVHHALRSDACVTMPPPQLVRETEDLIFMSILNQPVPVLAEEPEQTKRKWFMAWFSTGATVLGTMVLVLLPLLTNPIAYERVPVMVSQVGLQRDRGAESEKTGDKLLAIAATEKDNGHNTAIRVGRSHRRPVEQATPVPAVAFVRNSGAEDAPADARMAASVEVFDNGDPLNKHDVYAQENDIVVQSEVASVASSDEGAWASLRPNSAALASVSVLPQGVFPGIAFSNRVHLTSTFGYDVLENPNRKSSGLSFFSQSLAYAISDDENAGIELGYLWFDYSKPVLRFIPNSSGAKGDDDQGSRDPFGFDTKGGADKIQGQSVEATLLQPNAAFGPLDGEYVSEMQTLPKQTWWGAAFYERTLYQKNDVSLQGRLGLGGSNDGALAYVRAVGLYRLLDNVSLSLGFDARGMLLRTSYVAPKTSAVKTSFSLV